MKNKPTPGVVLECYCTDCGRKLLTYGITLQEAIAALSKTSGMTKADAKTILKHDCIEHEYEP